MTGLSFMISIVILTLLCLGIVAFGRYMYQRGFEEGLEEAARIMAEVRGVDYETLIEK